MRDTWLCWQTDDAQKSFHPKRVSLSSLLRNHVSKADQLTDSLFKYAASPLLLHSSQPLYTSACQECALFFG